MNERMTGEFTSFLTVSQSHQDDGTVIMEYYGSMESRLWLERFPPLTCLEPGTASPEGSA